MSWKLVLLAFKAAVYFSARFPLIKDFLFFSYLENRQVGSYGDEYVKIAWVINAYKKYSFMFLSLCAVDLSCVICIGFDFLFPGKIVIFNSFDTSNIPRLIRTYFLRGLITHNSTYTSFMTKRLISFPVLGMARMNSKIGRCLSAHNIYLSFSFFSNSLKGH